MQRSSESIAALAAALAKAQIELSNPEKSLLGTIKLGSPAGQRSGEAAERVFRYASLASGLDIVRKTLGQHEIATVQTTAIDQGAGTVNLTTVLAHASGEWIASDWPVCAISETTTPRRMGAALTYARRYALFTLVGIAGEDDLDAPDLVTPTSRSLGPGRDKAPTGATLNGGAQGYGNGAQRRPVQRSPLRRNGKDYSSLPTPPLAPDASAQLRDRLLDELSMLAGGDEAALWAKRTLPEKNKLAAADAQSVERAFETKLSGFTIQKADEVCADSGTETPPHRKSRQRPKKRQQPQAIDKGTLALPEPRRIRDREHVRYVAQQPCLICERSPSDAHHLRFAQSRALGRKVSDEFTVPLCRGHHREAHHCGDEAAWWQKTGIDPTSSARMLWLETHPQAARANTMDVKGKGTRPVGRRDPNHATWK
jgi:ERF superfamily